MSSRVEGHAMALQPDGKIVVAGRDGSQMAVMRFAANGLLDTTFNKNGLVPGTYTFNHFSFSYSRGVAIQDDGKIILSGDGQTDSGDRVGALLRFNENGTTTGIPQSAPSSIFISRFGRPGRRIPEWFP